MSAVPYVTLADVVTNMQFQCEIDDLLSGLVTILADYLSDNPSLASVGMDTDAKNHMLRIVTGLTVATGTAINCYPRGFDDSLCFDLSGAQVFP